MWIPNSKFTIKMRDQEAAENTQTDHKARLEEKPHNPKYFGVCRGSANRILGEYCNRQQLKLLS
jgi:hypothetical protein